MEDFILKSIKSFCESTELPSLLEKNILQSGSLPHPLAALGKTAGGD